MTLLQSINEMAIIESLESTLDDTAAVMLNECETNDVDERKIVLKDSTNWLPKKCSLSKKEVRSRMLTWRA